MKDFLKNVCVYVMVVIVDMLLLSAFMHVNLFSSVTVFYYRTLYSAGLTVFLTLIVLISIAIVLKKRKLSILDLNATLIASSVVISGLMLALFITVAPLTIDRSYTIFSLADMYENEEHAFSAQEIEDRFSEIYIHEYQSTTKRVEEQLSIGNIQKVDNGYIITEKGKKLIRIFRWVEKIYPVEDKRIIYPLYSENSLL